MTKKGHQKFLPRKWKFFPQKPHSEILGPPKKFSVPPKLGAMSPPLFTIIILYVAKIGLLHPDNISIGPIYTHHFHQRICRGSSCINPAFISRNSALSSS